MSRRCEPRRQQQRRQQRPLRRGNSSSGCSSRCRLKGRCCRGNANARSSFAVRHPSTIPLPSCSLFCSPLSSLLSCLTMRPFTALILINGDGNKTGQSRGPPRHENRLCDKESDSPPCTRDGRRALCHSRCRRPSIPLSSRSDPIPACDQGSGHSFIRTAAKQPGSTREPTNSSIISLPLQLH